MSWIVPHAVTDGARDHMVKVTSAATTALLGRKNYQGFSSYWPAVAEDESADPRDRAFAQWLNTVEKVIFSSTLAGGHMAQLTHRRGRPRRNGEATAHAGGRRHRRSRQHERHPEPAPGRRSRSPEHHVVPGVGGGGARLFDDGPAGSSWSLTQMTGTGSGAMCLLYDRIQADR